MGMTHVPVNGFVIFELQPKSEKKTLLRLGVRMFGFMDPDVKKRFQKGMKQLLGQLKAAAED